MSKDPLLEIVAMTTTGRSSLAFDARNAIRLLTVVAGLVVAGFFLVQIAIFHFRDRDGIIKTRLEERQARLRGFVVGEAAAAAAAGDAAGVSERLAKVNPPEGLDYIVFNDKSSVVFSTRTELTHGTEYSGWDLNAGTTLSTMIAASPGTGPITWSGRPQPIRGWPKQPADLLFTKVGGARLFILAVQGNPHPVEEEIARTEWTLLAQGAGLALAVSGILFFLGNFDIGRITSLAAVGIGETVRAITKSQKEGQPIRRAGISCAEMAVLADRIDQAQILTAVRKSEREIARAEKTVREVLNSIYDAVIVLDENLSLIWINRRMEVLFQMSRKDLPRLKLKNFAEGDAEEQVFVDGIRAAWRGDAQIFECRCRRFAEGGSFPAEVSAQKVALPGANIVCASIRDVTAPKAAESALREALAALGDAKDAADRANSSKSEFLARMSHEIRTPMNAILGLAYLIRKSTSDPQAAKGLQKIHSSGLGLLRILNDVLDFSKLESGKVEILSEAFSTGELIGVVSDLAVVRMAGKPLRFMPVVDPGVPKVLRGDSFRIQQILTNLIENAIKFTAEGEIGMRVFHDPARGMLQFEIQDQGIGMTPEQQNRLFQSFEQADGSTSRRYGGSGLGLAICKKLVGLMGGTIGVISDPGHGSKFVFRVKAASCNPSELVASSYESEEVRTKLAGRRVLVVDDLEINREIAGEMIREAGCEVGFAESGLRAIEQVGAGHWDLIVLDLEMPEMDGFATARAIRELELPGHTRVPIIAMSAHAFAEFRIKATEAGMDGYVMKPVDIAILHSEMLRTIFGKRPLPAEPAQAAPGGPVNSDRALKLLGGNIALYRRMAGKFINDWAGTAEKIRELAESDTVEARRLSHSLKGLAASLGAEALSKCAADLEVCFASGDSAGAMQRMPALQSSLAETVAALRAFDQA